VIKRCKRGHGLYKKYCIVCISNAVSNVTGAIMGLLVVVAMVLSLIFCRFGI